MAEIDEEKAVKQLFGRTTSGRSWSAILLGAGGQATPTAHEIDGREYVVSMTDGHHFVQTPIGDQVIAFALPHQR